MKIGEKGTVLHTLVGSCVGVALWDYKEARGALLHIVLPSGSGVIHNIYKYADTGIPGMIEEMTKRGSRMINVTARIAGGSSMFNSDIGAKNITASKRILLEKGIRLTGEDVGGERGRNLYFHTDTGKFIIKNVSGEIKEI